MNVACARETVMGEDGRDTEKRVNCGLYLTRASNILNKSHAASNFITHPAACGPSA